jgi:multiple antibiotic resistance protein
MPAVVKSFILALSALLPLVNPLGSALMFLTVVGQASPASIRSLARKVAISTALFLLAIELGGAALFTFFGISLPVVQLAGGLVLAAMGWQKLNTQESDDDTEQSPDEIRGGALLKDKVFYPLTFPLTAGPGCIVVTATLSAHASRHTLESNLCNHLGIALAVMVLATAVFLSYAYAPKITRNIPAHVVRGILRVAAFVLLCIGTQIGWNGLETMLKLARA